MPQLTLKQHRMRAYLTVQELAKRAGVSTDTIWRIQKGEKPKPVTIWRIARVLNVHPDEVVEFSRTAGEVGRQVDRQLSRTVSSEFYEQHDLTALASQQGVKPIADPNELAGDFWPENETTEDFITTLWEWRHGELVGGVS